MREARERLETGKTVLAGEEHGEKDAGIRRCQCRNWRRWCALHSQTGKMKLRCNVCYGTSRVRGTWVMGWSRHYSTTIGSPRSHMRLVSVIGIFRLCSFFQFVLFLRFVDISNRWSLINQPTHTNCARRNKVTCSVGVPVLTVLTRVFWLTHSKVHSNRAWVQLSQCKYESP